MTDPVREALRACAELLSAAVDGHNWSAHFERLVETALASARAALAAPAPDAFARGRASGIEEAARAVAQWSPASANTDAWLRERDLVAAAIRALAHQPAQDGTAFAWVIERGDSQPCAPTYWTGPNNGGGWSQDHMDAVRFARKQDAERVACQLGQGYHRVCEHGWCGGPLPAPPAPAKGEG